MTEEFDLSPREVGDTPPRSLRNWIIVGALLAAGAFIVVQALGSAAVFYLNVDEAIDQRADLGGDVFRMQGNVVSEPATMANGEIEFKVGFNGVVTRVSHIGEEPSDLFELGQSVIVEGQFVGEVFQSTQILVKHSEEYVADNKARDGVGT